jgi:hypothetical protein
MKTLLNYGVSVFPQALPLLRVFTWRPSTNWRGRLSKALGVDLQMSVSVTSAYEFLTPHSFSHCV